MAMAGSALLEANRAEVDALNVFPVPDGDTGTNMSLTMQSAIREINSKEFLRADEASAALAKGALRGARGNSGVITSQLLRGFSQALSGVEQIHPTQFAQALKAGADRAYKAVMKPKEGTSLTVARVIAESALRQVEAAPDDYDALFKVILESGHEILKKTPDMLPALAEAGVVDSGGRGLLYIYTGYAAALRGESIEEMLASAAAEPGEFQDDHEGDLTFSYHVAFTLQHLREDCSDEDIRAFLRRLNRVGDRVNLEGEEAPYRVHVHTDNPGIVLESAIDLGEAVDIEILNLAAMRREKEEAAAAEQAAAEETPVERKPCGMVTVSLGNGFSQIFRELTVDSIVEGGQTMNPSTDDILQAIRHANAETVYVLPNNGNVVMAAKQAAELADCEVHVIPTKNVAMGIAAAVAFQPDVPPEENVRRMSEAAEHVKTATVTYAIRDSENNGVTIHQGDYIGLHNGQIACSGQNLDEVLDAVMKAVMTEDDELVTVYYGADVTEADARKVADTIGKAWPDCDIECLCGGQPLYYYLISVE